MLTFRTPAPGWGISEFSQLPDVSSVHSQQLRDYGLVAGGLALLLSRCSPRGVERDFQAASKAYRSLRKQITLSEAVELPPDLLNDVRHEVAQFADQATREALKRCAERLSVARKPAPRNGGRTALGI